MDNYVGKNDKKKRRAFEKSLKQNQKRREKHADVHHAVQLSSKEQTPEEKCIPEISECHSSSSFNSAQNRFIWQLLKKYGFSKENAVEAKVTFAPDLDKILRDPKFPSWEEIQKKCRIHHTVADTENDCERSLSHGVQAETEKLHRDMEIPVCQNDFKFQQNIIKKFDAENIFKVMLPKKFNKNRRWNLISKQRHFPKFTNGWRNGECKVVLDSKFAVFINRKQQKNIKPPKIVKKKSVAGRKHNYCHLIVQIKRKKIHIKMKHNERIDCIQKCVKKLTCIPFSDFIITYKKKQLNLNKTISFYKLPNLATLKIILKHHRMNNPPSLSSFSCLLIISLQNYCETMRGSPNIEPEKLKLKKVESKNYVTFYLQRGKDKVEVTYLKNVKMITVEQHAASIFKLERLSGLLRWKCLNVRRERTVGDVGIMEGEVLELDVPLLGGGKTGVAEDSGNYYYNDKTYLQLSSFSSPQYQNFNLNKIGINNFPCNAGVTSSSSYSSQKASNNFERNDNDVKEQNSGYWKNLNTVDRNLLCVHQPKNSDSKRVKNSVDNNKSTLSLHIRAYDNLIKASSVEKKNSASESKKQKPLSANDVIIKTPFEFSRQQEDDSITEPEVMQFKASQQLFNSNMSYRTHPDFYNTDSSDDEVVDAVSSLANLFISSEAEVAPNSPSYEHENKIVELTSNSDVENARQGSPEYILDYDYNDNEEEDISLISDSAATETRPINNNDIVEISDSSSSETEESLYPVKIENDLTSKDLLKIALNLDKSYTRCEVNFAPLKVPETSGLYLAIVPGSSLKNIADIFGCDMLSPWNSGNSRAKQYFIDFEAENDKIVKYERVKQEKKDMFATYCFEYQARHPTIPQLSKKIIGVVQPQNKKPIENTNVVVYYKLSENCPQIAEKCSRANFNPRLNPSNSAAIKNLTKTTTPRNAIISHNQSNSIISGLYPAVTEKQAQNVAGHDPLREAPTNKGVKPKINFEAIHKMAQQQNFVLEYGQSGGDIFIFCASKTSLEMMKSSLVTSADVQKLSKKVEEALMFESDERYEQLQKIVNSAMYQNINETGIALIDTTFNLSCAHLTILMFSSPHLLRDGKPACFTGCYFLSTKKDACAYEYMAKFLDKWLAPNGKIFRCLITDADPSLDVFMRSKTFGEGCIKLQCIVHLKENIEGLCDKDARKILNDIFGTTIDNIRYKGLLDELTFPEFEQKLQFLFTLSYWQENPRLLEWFKKEYRQQKLFQRYGVVSRIKSSLAFAESDSNVIEGENMIMKDDINDNTPIQVLIPLLEKRSHAQITPAGMAFVQHEPVSLRNATKFVGVEKWRRLSVDKKKELLLSIGLSNTDLIPGFSISPTTFPVIFSQNLSEKERDKMTNSAMNLEVLQSAVAGTFVVMTSSFPITVSVKEKVQCSCKYREKHLLLCEHVLAVHMKHPSLNILEKLEKMIETESMADKHGHLTGINTATKPGTSRRRGRASTRNTTNVITEVRDREIRTNNTPSIILNRIGTSSSQPHITPISTYNAQRQLETRPVAMPPRPETFHQETATALRNYKLAYSITENELWYNSNAFHLKYSRNVRDAHNRKCCHCNMQISRTQTVVFTHIEKYEFVMKTTNQVRVGYGERICCAKYDCFISRYPYADIKCIISEVSEEKAEEVLNFIFAP